MLPLPITLKRNYLTALVQQKRIVTPGIIDEAARALRGER